MHDAVELTAESLWFLGDRVESGTFPWVLALTPPYRDRCERAAFVARQTDTLSRLGVMTDGRVAPLVAQWIRIVCRAERWLEMRCVGGGLSRDGLLRGIVARRGDRTVVALRAGGLITLSEVRVDDPYGLVPVVTAGLPGRPPADFDEFALPTVVGARADDQLRNGAELSDVIDHLGIRGSARAFVESVFSGPACYVEVVAGQSADTRTQTSEVGIAVVDAPAGRAVISPNTAFDGQWVSTFEPGTPFAIALALERVAATLPDGRWFTSTTVTRDFTGQGC